LNLSLRSTREYKRRHRTSSKFRASTTPVGCTIGDRLLRLASQGAHGVVSSALGLGGVASFLQSLLNVRGSAATVDRAHGVMSGSRYYGN
jgi:hypothetical protein